MPRHCKDSSATYARLKYLRWLTLLISQALCTSTISSNARLIASLGTVSAPRVNVISIHNVTSRRSPTPMSLCEHSARLPEIPMVRTIRGTLPYKHSKQTSKPMLGTRRHAHLNIQRTSARDSVGKLSSERFIAQLLPASVYDRPQNLDLMLESLSERRYVATQAQPLYLFTAPTTLPANHEICK